MNFKNLAQISIIGLAAMMASCNNGENKSVAVKSNGAVPVQEAKTMNIAYVELDSLQTQYQYFLDAKAALETKSKKYDSELNRLGANFQKAAADFQEKAQKGLFTSQAEGEAAQKKILDKQAEIERKQAKYAQELTEDQMRFNLALQDSLNHFIADYNQTHKYSMILSKTGGNILFAEKAMDITADVITGLNKRYKKQK